MLSGKKVPRPEGMRNSPQSGMRNSPQSGMRCLLWSGVRKCMRKCMKIFSKFPPSVSGQKCSNLLPLRASQE